MRIIHISDTHFGFKRHDDFMETADQLITKIKTINPHLILHSGDLFHKSSPPNSVVIDAVKFLKTLNKIAPVVLIAGNHDMSGRNLTAINLIAEMDLPNVFISTLPNHFELAGCNIYTMPYPSDQGYYITLGKKRTIAQKLNELSISFGKHLEKQNKRSKKTKNNILLCHFSISGIKGAERKFILGHDLTLEVDALLKGNWSYVGLGHIHSYNELSDKPKIVYVGSLDRTSFAEEHEAKYFTSFEIEDNQLTNFQKIKLDTRPYQTIKYNCSEDVELMLWAKNVTIEPGAIVRCQLTLDNRRYDQNQLKRIFKDAKDVTFEVATIDNIRIKKKVKNGNRLIGMTDNELISEFLSRKLKDDTKTKELIEMASEIME